MKRARNASVIFIHLLLVTSAVVTVFPLIMIGLMAFKTNNEIFTDPTGLPTVWHFEHLAEAWVLGNFGTYYLNSIIVAVPTVLLVVICSNFAAYGLVFGRLKGTKVLLGLFLLGLIMPLQAIILPLFHNLGDASLLNSHYGLILAQTAVGIPFGIFLMRSFFLGLPSEIIEAARLDGALDLTVFTRVVLPLSAPPALTLATLQFMYSWNDFLLPLMILQDSSLRTVTLGLFFLQGGTYTLNYAMISAGVILTAVPIMFVFFMLQKQFISGATAGAVK